MMAIVVTRCFCTLTLYSMMICLLNLEVSLRRILNGLTQDLFWSNVPARFKMCLPIWLPATALWAGLATGIYNMAYKEYDRKQNMNIDFLEKLYRQ